MTEDRKTPNPNPKIQQKRGQIEDPLIKGMHADGGQILHGAGMSASAQQSGRGLGESSMSRNWDAGGDPAQDERGTVSTGPDTSPQERQRQQHVHEDQQRSQQQHQSAGGTQPAQQKSSDPNRGHEQPPLDATTPPDVLARNPDVTKR